MLEVDILGCGSSLGVPVLACACYVCKSDSIYNKRLRSSIIISKNTTKNELVKILVDFGFNIKEQLLKAGITNLDAAILTHDHADHVSGIDELRVFGYNSGKPLAIFVHESVAPAILSRYGYLFDSGKLQMKEVKWFERIVIRGVELQFFPQIHGPIRSFGIKIDNFVYSSDISEVVQESEKYLYGVDAWVVDCIDYVSTSRHAGLSKVLEWSKKYDPQKIYLTNMSHKIDYHKIITELSGGFGSDITPLYDGFKIKL